VTEKNIVVVSTETVPQGVAALLAFDYEADLQANAQLMTKAKGQVKTIEVTRAVRSTQISGLNIKKKQTIGLLDGELLAAGNSAIDVLDKILSRLDLDEVEVITVYYGIDTELTEAEQISATIHEQHPQLQIEVVRGGQPHYNYIISIE
jgi:hypothetical protein